MVRKKILIIESSGLDRSKINFIKKKFKKLKIISCKDELNSILNLVDEVNAIINLPRRFLSKNLIKKANSLQWLHCGGAGVEEYLIPDMVNSNIILTNGKILQGPEVSDHAIALLLSISRNISQYLKIKNVRKLSRPIELRGKQCLIFGLGGIGILIAEKLKAFGMYTVGVSLEIIPNFSFIDEKYLFHDGNFIKKIKSSDVIICAAPLTNYTKKYFNNDFFKLMKKNSIFINISRGKLVNTNDLVKFIKKGAFLGVGLDVTDPEPLDKNHFLNKSNKVLLTPHMAGPSDHNRKRSFDLIIKNLELFSKNQKLLNQVDKNEGY